MAVGAAAAVGCDLPGGSSDEDAGPGSPRRGGTLRFGSTTPPSYGLDPHLEQGGALPIIARLYGYPFHVDPRDDSLILDHAESVEQPAADVYVVRLGEHGFHNGSRSERVRSHDVVRSMWRYRDHPLVLNDWWHTNMLEGSGGADERTIVIKAKRPYVYSLAEMGDINGGAILPEESIEDELDLRRGGAGSGPLELDDGDPASPLRLRRFESYASEIAWVDAMEWHTFDSGEAMLAAFHERRLDIVALGDARAAGEARSIDGVAVAEQPSLSWLSLGLRVDRPPFADERVRRAIDIALDRQSMIDAVGVRRGEIAGPVNRHLGGGYWALPDEEIVGAQLGDRPVEERMVEARRLIRAAGADGVATAIRVSDLPALRDLAGIIAQQLESVGLRAALSASDLTSWFFDYRRGEFEAILISHPPFETPDGSLRLYHSSEFAAEGNPFRYADPSMDGLIERSWGETSREERRQTILRAQRMLIEARPLIQLFAPNEYAAAHGYVGDSGLVLPGSLARYHYRQWLGPAKGRPD